MELLGKSRATQDFSADEPLYRALVCGDIPAAYIISKDLKEKSNPYTAFNCALCLYRLGEWEKSLADLKRSEQSLGNQPEYDISERKLFLKSFEIFSEGAALIPLDPSSPKKCGRYALIRVRYLIALCLFKLGRDSEAAPLIRFLEQYNIKL